MYTQFFGNYLLSKGCITPDQLFSAMQKQENAHFKLGTLAIHAGYMNASQVDQVVIEQTHADRKFGEIAVDLGFLSDDQVVELLKSQKPDFLLLGQILVDDGILTNADLEKYINEYRSENELLDLDMTKDNNVNIEKLLTKMFVSSEIPPTSLGVMYLELLFNDFVRFLGEDFTILGCNTCKSFPVECCAVQKVVGDYSVNSYINMDESTAIAFASRYVGEQFTEYDEYVWASMEDFLNLQNGLFIVNVSNEESLELTITPPELVESPEIDFDNLTYHFSVMYSFGMVHFVIEIVKTNEE